MQAQIEQLVLENKALKNEGQSLTDCKQELIATVDQMKADQQELEKKMAQTCDEKSSLEVRTENLEAELCELHHQLLCHKEENTAMQTQVEQLVLENNLLKREAQLLDDCKQELSELSSTLSHVKLEKEDIEKKVAELHLEKVTIEKSLENLTANFHKLYHESMQHQEEKAVLNTKLNKVLEKNEALQSELDEAHCEVAELKSSVAHLHDEISIHEQLKQDMLEQLDGFGDMLALKTSLEEKLASALVEVDSLQSSNVKFGREMIALEDANRAARNDIAKLLQEREQLEEIIQSCHEGREEVEVKLSDATRNLGILKEKADSLSCENLRQREALTDYARQLEAAVLRADRYKCVCSELDRQKRELRDQLKQLSEELTQVKDEQMSNLIEQLNSMAADAERWKASFEALQMRVAPFQEQLELYEMEKELLEKRNEATESELSKLYSKVSEMMGHQNHKQKIHYLSNLLEEQHKSRKELHILREKNLKQTKEIAMLQVQLSSQKMKQGQRGTLNQTAKENMLPKPPM
uniref:Signal transducer n=1 Tax=Rhipicephalus appendiculatus TaxID=34631 RepID=A0A131Z6V1_RHIAP